MALADRLTEGVAAWRDADAALQSVREWVGDSLDAALSGVSDATQVYVAIDGEVLQGFASVSTSSHWTGAVDGYIGELVVADDAEGQGIGRRLVETAMSWAAARGAGHLTIETGGANSHARAFYESLGFELEEVRLTVALGEE